LDEDFDLAAPASKRHKPNASEQKEDADGMIVLNVGGIKYHTTLHTLTGFDSMLKAKFSRKYSLTPQADGSYFIDADGPSFQYILKYLRTGKLLLPKAWTNSDIYSFFVEVKFLCVESLYNPVLLKLFGSKILTHDLLKLKVIHKVCEKMGWNRLQTMQGLNQWVNKGRVESTAIDTSNLLILVRASDKVYGMFAVVYERGNSNSWFWNFKKSFAFNCGPNSCRLLESESDYGADIALQFKPVRKVTEEEKKMDNKDGVEYTYALRTHPLTVRGTVTKNDNTDGIYSSLLGKTKTTWEVKFWDKNTDKFRFYSDSEVWSIPSPLPSKKTDE